MYFVLCPVFVQENIGQAWTFYSFGAIGMVAIAFIFSAVPETKGLTLEQIQGKLAPGGGSPWASCVKGGRLPLMFIYPALISAPMRLCGKLFSVTKDTDITLMFVNNGGAQGPSWRRGFLEPCHVARHWKLVLEPGLSRSAQ